MKISKKKGSEVCIDARAQSGNNNNQGKLSTTQQDYLARYIERLTERYLPPTREVVQDFATAIGHCYISMSWDERFLTSYESTLKNLLQPPDSKLFISST